MWIALSLYFNETIGVFLQVITNVIGFVVSIIGIAIPLQKDEIYGVNVYKINEFRTNVLIRVKSFCPCHNKSP